MVGLAFAIAASCNFPVLLMSMFWKGLTTKGALIGGLLGLISAVTLVVLGPTVWEKVLGHPAGSAPFPYENPALFSMTIAFVGIWLFSVLDRSQTAKSEAEAYESQYIRSETPGGGARGRAAPQARPPRGRPGGPGGGGSGAGPRAGPAWSRPPGAPPLPAPPARGGRSPTSPRTPLRWARGGGGVVAEARVDTLSAEIDAVLRDTALGQACSSPLGIRAARRCPPLNDAAHQRLGGELRRPASRAASGRR